ncbi:helix-turn-helix transcriptional regulator [Bacillus paramycoides]|uniref:helix-turn-helix transcriptional regulator n=1 Tax=Bacillus paramycoides TaxID=2026194 RepID=UPI00405A46E8
MKSFQMLNPEDANCPVSIALNSIHWSNSLQKTVDVHTEEAQGCYRKIVVKPALDINISDVTFRKEMTIISNMNHPVYYLAFCMGDALQWKMEGHRKEYEIETGESFIFNGVQGKSTNYYFPKQRFWGVSIPLETEMLTHILHQLKEERTCATLIGNNTSIYQKKYSFAIKRILHDIMNCRYEGQVKRMYLEGKILELVAVYLDEVIFENGKKSLSCKLSASDIQSLHDAKKLLDENITDPPTIKKLARVVCLNEYKLKTGFKALFGMPAHAYVIDKRLELAKFLLEEKKLNVTQAALFIGYQDASHFAKKFRKKYNINPSEYTKNMH